MHKAGPGNITCITSDASDASFDSNDASDASFDSIDASDASYHLH